MFVPMLQVTCENSKHLYLVRPDSRLEEDIEKGKLPDRKLAASECEGCIDDLNGIASRRRGFAHIFDTFRPDDEMPHGPYYGDLMDPSMALR